MGDEGDDLSKARGNTDHDPKPDNQSRKNVLMRGLGAPAPSLGPGGNGGYRPPRDPERPHTPNKILMDASRKQTGQAPLVSDRDRLDHAPALRRTSRYEVPDLGTEEQNKAMQKKIDARLAEMDQKHRNKHHR